MTDGWPRIRYTIEATAALLIRASPLLLGQVLYRMTTFDLRKALRRRRTVAAWPRPVPAA